MNFRERATEEELMDTEPVTFEDFRACLVELASFNGLSFAYHPTIAFFEALAARGWPRGRPLEVVDIGSGYGDMLRRVDAWAARRGLAVSLTGVDLNPWSRRAALEATADGRNIQWVTSDVFAYDPPAGIDVVMSALFTHHLPNPLVVKFLSWMQATARVGWFVTDLHRHPLPYHFFRVFSRLARYHRFMQHDGPLSVARAFTRHDWQSLLRAAGINEDAVEIRWRVPFRLTVQGWTGRAE